MLEVEPLLEELVDLHNLQWYDILFLVLGWLMVHRPFAQEEYADGTRPIFFYGHLEKLKSFLVKKKKSLKKVPSENKR